MAQKRVVHRAAKGRGGCQPDFLARLKDGRIALIEYKGGNLLSSDDAKEKLNIGKLWEEKSEGRGIFLLVSEAQAQYSLYRQLALQA